MQGEPLGVEALYLAAAERFVAAGRDIEPLNCFQKFRRFDFKSRSFTRKNT